MLYKDRGLRGYYWQAGSDLVSKISGKTYRMESNEQGLREIVFDLDTNEPVVRVKWEAGTSGFPVGSPDSFETGSVTIPMMGFQPVATSGGWITGNTFQLISYLYETPYYFNHIFTFDGEELILDGGINVSFGGREQKPVSGRQVQQ